MTHCMPDVEQTLKNLGLSENETKVYLAVLALGKGSASSVADRAGIYRTLAYEVLASLVLRGLVSMVIERRKRIYIAAPPTTLITQLAEKERAVRQVLPQLDRLYTSKIRKPDVSFFLGAEGYKALLDDILAEGKDFCSLGAKLRMRKSIKYYFSYFVRERVRRGIKARLILDGEPLTTELTEFRLVKKRFPVSTWVYGNKVAIISYSETEPVALLIRNREIARYYKDIFDMLWESLPIPAPPRPSRRARRRA